MGQMFKRMFYGLITCLAVLLIPFKTAAAINGSQADRLLQPQGLERVGVYALRQIEPGLTGDGVKFAVICRSFTYIDGEPQNDYRPNIGHNCFKTSRFTFFDQGVLPAGFSPHSTSICSILFGEDPESYNSSIGPFYYQGTTPQAQADIYEFWNFVSNNVFYNTPPDADIITASIGMQFEDWWTRGIESLVEQYGVIVVAGIGNGANSYDPVLYPGACANVIGVGVINSVNTDDPATSLANFALAYPENSSNGPTASGRCKPDIIAPGNCLAADANEPNRYEPTGNWSSFSTPIVSGTIGLLVQKAKQERDLRPAVSPKGGNCVIKAILLNSATKLPYWHKGRLQADDDHTAPLDYIQGAGMLNAVGAYANLVAGISRPGPVSSTGWDLNAMNKNAAVENNYRFIIDEPDGKFITATIAWNKHYSNQYPFEPIPEKDSNLRLELWAIDPGNPNNNYLLDYSDSSIDNIEHIYAATDPEYTNYEVIVSFSEDSNPAMNTTLQQYGLAWRTSNKEENDDIFWYDLYADGIVDESDFTVLLNNLSDGTLSPDKYQFGDINTDGVVDVNDLKILMTKTNQQAAWRAKL